MLLLTVVVAPAGHVVVQMAVQVAVLAVVSAAGMLPVLGMVQVLVAVEGDTWPSPAASDGCPLGMMMLTVVVAMAGQVVVQMVVQVAVSAAVPAAEQVAGLSVLMVGTSPSPGASDAWSALPWVLFPLPTLADAAGTLALAA
ncbi:hypothetical protein NDU88_005677 [Pleurodeles waltl]|uniref:Uncharacterized protein n=1 Tax=Pleurodeles waltl TaxID=8319 RepID=A0AAV7LQ78_PLEWA|nr:hypothetical protein NDU88_005677 [Pleurodeles waltl]